ncbi:MAG: hypothetical protein GTN95_09255 [Gammaproteobacteria bacterium]|nr:hypothetical protein [Gammaproteobacteria bacterium]
MNIDELTIKDLKTLNGLLQNNPTNQSHFYDVGKNYIIRTVTNYYIGKLVAVSEKEILLEKAVWVADTGRFTDALLKGKLDEVELFHPDHPVIVGRGALVDAQIWVHEIPKEQK